jgi:hypothetical protein
MYMECGRSVGDNWKVWTVAVGGPRLHTSPIGIRPSPVHWCLYHGSPQSTFDHENCQQVLAIDARVRTPFAEVSVPA